MHRADAVRLFQAVLVPALDDARVAVALGDAGSVHLVACRKDVRLDLVPHFVALDTVEAHFAQDFAGGDPGFFELTEIGLVERLLLGGNESQLERRVAVRLGRFDLNYGAGTCLDDRDGNHFPVFRKQLGHANLAADDCFTHVKFTPSLILLLGYLLGSIAAYSLTLISTPAGRWMESSSFALGE